MGAEANQIGVESFRRLPNRFRRVVALDNLWLDPEAVTRVRRDEGAQLRKEVSILILGPRRILSRGPWRVNDVEDFQGSAPTQDRGGVGNCAVSERREIRRSENALQLRHGARPLIFEGRNHRHADFGVMQNAP